MIYYDWYIKSQKDEIMNKEELFHNVPIDLYAPDKRGFLIFISKKILRLNFKGKICQL